MNDVSYSTIALLIARHFAGWLGGYLIHKGYLDADGLTGFVGAVMTIAAVGGSWWQKKGQALALADAGRAYSRLVGLTTKKPPAPSVVSKT